LKRPERWAKHVGAKHLRPEHFRPRLVAFDLDGTLLGSERTLSPRNRAAVAGLVARGVRVVICTGRPPRTTRTFAEQLALVDLAIVYNGGAVYNFAEERALARFDFPSEVARTAVARLRAEHPGVMCGLESAYGWFVDAGRYEIVRQGTVPYETEPDGVGDIVDFMQEEVTKLLFWHPSTPTEALARTLADLPVHATWSMPGLLEVVGPEVNKRAALARVAAELGIGAHAVAAFGDQHNDREMLAWAGFGVAMGNADGEVQALADWVAGHADDDGVAEVVERWL
jgi:Cof subfamily protein (haloacid dehalogenase superfamily)